MKLNRLVWGLVALASIPLILFAQTISSDYSGAIPNGFYLGAVDANNIAQPMVGMARGTSVIDIDPDAVGVTMGGSLTVAGAVTPTGRLDLSSVSPAAANTDGAVIRAGTTASPLNSSADSQSMARLIFDLDNTGSYGLYSRSYISTAGISSDANRFFATVNNVAAATVRGAHTSLSFGTTGTITGLGVAEETTLHIPSGGDPGGTLAASKFAINSDGTTDPATTALSFVQFVNQGDATGANHIDDVADLFSITGSDIGADNMIEAGASAPDLADITHAIRIDIDGTNYYLVVSDQNPDTW